MSQSLKPIHYNATTCTKCGEKVKKEPGATCKCGFTTNYVDGNWLITKEGKSYTHNPLNYPTSLKTNLK